MATCQAYNAEQRLDHLFGFSSFYGRVSFDPQLPAAKRAVDVMRDQVRCKETKAHSLQSLQTAQPKTKPLYLCHERIFSFFVKEKQVSAEEVAYQERRIGKGKGKGKGKVVL